MEHNSLHFLNHFEFLIFYWELAFFTFIIFLFAFQYYFLLVITF
jgi:hypothetical protein